MFLCQVITFVVPSVDIYLSVALLCYLQQRAITVIICETRPRARQKRYVINVDNIARVPTVNERIRWDLPCIINLNARSLNTEKIDELQVIASNFNVSIICVTETWLKKLYCR